MTHDNLVKIVKEISSGVPDNDAIDEMLNKLERFLPYSDICDLIFQDFRNLTPEQVVDEALQQETTRSQDAHRI